MSDLFSTTPTVAIPAFLTGAATAPAPSAATLDGLSPNAAPAPAMGVETYASAQSVELQSLQKELKRIRKEINQLLKAIDASPPPAAPSVIGQTWNSLTEFLFGAPAPVTPPAQPVTPPSQPVTPPSQPVTPEQPVTPPQAEPPGTRQHGATKFVLSSFNVLSSSAGKGKGYASGVSRMHAVEQILKNNHVSVVGFQEMDSQQLAEFKKIAGDEYGTFAGSSGKKGYHDTTIAWRKDQWKLEDTGTITVPSYAGRASKVPFVRLRNKETGQEAYFVDAHNPANTKRYHNQERFRDAAARQEAALVKRLMAQTGLPVFMVGDMNSVREAREIFTENAPLKAANPKGKAGIDWIFGSKKGVEFSQFRRTREGLIGKTTDHPVVFSHVKIDD